MQELKLCRDCIFCRKGLGIEYCVNPVFPQRTDVVNGDVEKNYCTNLRAPYSGGSYIGLCGQEAKYFEEVRPLGEILKDLWKKLWNR